jgi:cutinase
MLLSLLTVLSLSGLSFSSPVAAPSGNIEERETPLNEFLTILLSLAPALSGTLNSVGSVLTVFENALATATGDQTTYNELTGACMDYTVIFARGTTEPGNVGILAGPPFFDALSTTLTGKTIAIQGVNSYPGSISDYLAGGSTTGSAEM